MYDDPVKRAIGFLGVGAGGVRSGIPRELLERAYAMSAPTADPITTGQAIVQRQRGNAVVGRSTPLPQFDRFAGNLPDPEPFYGDNYALYQERAAIERDAERYSTAPPPSVPSQGNGSPAYAPAPPPSGRTYGTPMRSHVPSGPPLEASHLNTLPRPIPSHGAYAPPARQAAVRYSPETAHMVQSLPEVTVEAPRELERVVDYGRARQVSPPPIGAPVFEEQGPTVRGLLQAGNDSRQHAFMSRIREWMENGQLDLSQAQELMRLYLGQ